MITPSLRWANSRRSLFTLSLLAGLMSISPEAQAAPTPNAIGGIISYQGQLTDSTGKPIANGTPSLTFTIYDGTTSVFTQTAPVATVGGVFNTFLSVGALEFDPGKAYNLGVTYNGVESKHPIAAVPVAINAAKAAKFTGDLAGDVSGTQSAVSVDKIKGTPVTATAPTDGQVLAYDAANTQWKPTTIATPSARQYAYIYSTTAQVVPIDVDVNFDSNGPISSGFLHTPGSSLLFCFNSGTYRVNTIVSGLEPNQFALCVNGVPIPGATYGSGAGTQQNNGQALVTLAAGDVLSLQNYGSNATVILQTLAGGIQTNVNASLLVEKID